MTKSHSDLKLEEYKNEALALMSKAGFPIEDHVDVRIDKDLKYMGYTTTMETGKPLIVVAGFALESGMAINLLVHELSHIYRSQSGHPSHDYQVLTGIAGWVMQGQVHHKYQQDIVENILNHLQDVYADDISFAIFKKSTSNKNLNQFFLSWIHEPSTSKDPVERAWENAGNLVGTAFAEANLIRHKVPDTDDVIAKAVKNFLSKVDKRLEERYAFFKEFMVRMPEKVTQKEFESHLIKFLGEFLKLTKTA